MDDIFRNIVIKLRSGAGQIIFVLLVVFSIFIVHSGFAEKSASEKASAMCASIKPGSDASELRDRAIQDGANDFQTRWIKTDGVDHLFITYVGTPPFSRHICHIEANEGHIISATLTYLD